MKASEEIDMTETKLKRTNDPIDNKNETLFPTKGTVMDTAFQRFKSIEDTIRAYTTHTLSAFRDIAAASVEKVTLEFGIKAGGEAGIPYVTKGTAESNLKITVECSFPKE